MPHLLATASPGAHPPPTLLAGCRTWVGAGRQHSARGGGQERGRVLRSCSVRWRVRAVCIACSQASLKLSRTGNSELGVLPACTTAGPFWALVPPSACASHPLTSDAPACKVGVSKHAVKEEGRPDKPGSSISVRILVIAHTYQPIKNSVSPNGSICLASAGGPAVGAAGAQAAAGRQGGRVNESIKQPLPSSTAGFTASA